MNDSAWQSNSVTRSQLIQPEPTLHSEELVIRGCSHCPPQLSCQPKQWLSPCTKDIGCSRRFQFVNVWIEAENLKISLPLQITNRHIPSHIRQIHSCISAQATRLAQIRQYRPLISPLLHRPRKLRGGEHWHVQLPRQLLE